MDELERNKQIIREFVQAVWVERDVHRLPEFWTTTCINHASSGARGLDALRTYHEGFYVALEAFSDPQVEILEQVAEDQKVVTRLVFRGRHDREFMGHAPTGKVIALETIRIDQLGDGKIAEHGSVADMAGLMTQLET